jgi:small redox-active disulfide protein 2
MEIKVLGPGCRKCREQYDSVRAAVEELGLDATVTKVERVDQIADLGVLFTPALVVDGEVVASGKVVGGAKLVGLLRGVSR